jgi:hypothetical protein
MKVRRAALAAVRVVAAMLSLAMASGCAAKASGRQTASMEKSGTLNASAAELRARVNDLARRTAGRIEEAADLMRVNTPDRAVRRRALVFKMDAIPAVYSAAYRVDPFAGAIDVWVLGFQMTHYLEDGAGREAFGAEQSVATKCAHDILADTDAVVRSMVTGTEAFDRGRARAEDWATQHPIGHSFASRASADVLMAELRSGEQSAFQAVGAVSDTIENLSERLNTYAELLPRQSRWQAELLIDEMAGDRSIAGALDDINAIGTTARNADDLIDTAQGVLSTADSSVREALAAERQAVLTDVDRQRLQTLAYVTAERLAVLAAARGERIAVVEALQQERIAVIGGLRQERIEGLKEGEAIESRAVAASLAGLRDLVNDTLWRVAVMLVFLMVLAAAIGVVAYRLTLGRRLAATGP